MTIENI